MCEMEIRERILKMYEPKAKKRKEVASTWIKEILSDLVKQTEEEVVLIDPVNNIYLRCKEYQEANRIEPIGFYRGRNWGERTLWGAPLEELTAGDYWKSLMSVINWYQENQSVVA